MPASSLLTSIFTIDTIIQSAWLFISSVVQLIVISFFCLAVHLTNMKSALCV